MKPIIRCSGLDRLLACPGSRTLESRLGSSAPHGDAMTWRGNWCHGESAARLVRNHGASAPDGIAAPDIPVDWKPQPWDERAVDWYVANVIASTPDDHAIFVEHRITVEFERFILTGQLDVYTVDPIGTEFTIDDQKSGVNEVDVAENNWQLAGYACLLKRHIPTLRHGTARILQRTATMPISEVEIDDLDRLLGYLERQINAALDARLTVETGYKQCRLCPCIEPCPALRAEIEAMKAILTDEITANAIVTYDTRQLAELAARGRAIAGPIDRLLETLKRRIADEGHDIILADGTQVSLVEEPGRRQVTHPRVAFGFVKDKLGEDAAWETLSLSLTDLEDQLVASGMKRTSKKEGSATSWVKDHLSHVIARPPIKKLKFT